MSFSFLRRRLTGGPLAGLARGLAALVASAGLWAAPLTKGPYLQAPGDRTMTVMWETLTEEPAMLFYGEREKLDQAIGPVRPTRIQSGASTYFVYAARLEALTPSTTYGYEVRVGAERSGARRFRTFGSAPEKVTFIAYGDTRTNPDKHAAVAAHFRRHAPEFILHSGDLVSKGSQYELWSREFFAPLARVIDEVPVLPSIGNHEQDGANYLAYFPSPGAKRFYYSADIGPVHVVTLDYHSTSAADEQFRFVREDLAASRAPWKLVLLHYPMFNLGGHATFWGHESYLPLFRALQVDLVLAGHSHLYERFRPLAPREQPGAWIIQHVTTGGGGAPLAAAVPDPSLVKAEKAHHFLVLTATRARLDARCIDLEGRELDAFALTKEDGRQPAAYREQVYPEEAVIAAGQALPKKTTKK